MVEMEQLIAGIIDIMQKVRTKVMDDADVNWTTYDTPEEFRQEIDHLMTQLHNEDHKALDRLYAHFLPTCTFQELATTNGWEDEYLRLAEDFDKLYFKIKK